MILTPNKISLSFLQSVLHLAVDNALRSWKSPCSAFRAIVVQLSDRIVALGAYTLDK